MTSESLVNPALTNWTGPLGLPHFSAIADDDFLQAFEAAMQSHLAEIETIAGNVGKPTFANTLDAFELAGMDLNKVQALFWHRAGTDSTSGIKKLEREVGPMLASHSAKIFMHEGLFARIAGLYDRRAELGLSSEQDRVLELQYKQFVKQGARLSNKDKKRLAEIDKRLAVLAAQFGQNVLADESTWTLVLEHETDLAGLPDSLVAAMAEAASERGLGNDKHAVTLSRSIIEPFLSSSEHRDLRKVAFEAWAMRGQNGGETDNAAVVAETLKLRDEKAGLLGYDSFAELKLDGTMAKTSKAVEALLGEVWPAALASANVHRQKLEEIAVSVGDNESLQAWDWRYYSALLKEREFDLNEGELKPYFLLDNMIEAAFDVAGRLFGLSFRQREDVVGPHPESRVFEVRNAAGRLSGVFVGDYFARASKRSGAWMSALQSQHGLGDGQLPIILNVMNFAKPAKGSPALLSMDDARTLFHEFGHALHGLLSRVTYPSISGTAVSRDFVELPSQLYEHWLTVPEVLQKHARHARTGEQLPQAMLDKVLASNCFNAGFNAVEFVASAYVDIRFHQGSGKASSDGPLEFEAAVLAELNMPDEIIMRHRTPHFLHVFYGDGYASGYYSYMWSEVLDADAFAAFEETGDPFNAAMASRLLEAIYASGGSRDPEAAYKAFRGRLPNAQAMLKKRGLAA